MRSEQTVCLRFRGDDTANVIIAPLEQGSGKLGADLWEE